MRWKNIHIYIENVLETYFKNVLSIYSFKTKDVYKTESMALYQMCRRCKFKIGSKSILEYCMKTVFQSNQYFWNQGENNIHWIFRDLYWSVYEIHQSALWVPKTKEANQTTCLNNTLKDTCYIVALMKQPENNFHLTDGCWKFFRKKKQRYSFSEIFFLRFEWDFFL